MSACLSQAESYRQNQFTVVQTKQSIVVAFFFSYSVYVIVQALKHCCKYKKMNCNEDNLTERKKFENWETKFSRIQHDILGKSFFLFFLMFVSSQVFSSVYAAVFSYFYLGTLGV